MKPVISLFRGGQWYPENRGSRRILAQSWNLGNVSTESRRLGLFLFGSEIAWVSGSDFETRVSASRRVSDFTFRHPSVSKRCSIVIVWLSQLPQPLQYFRQSSWHQFLHEHTYILACEYYPNHPESLPYDLPNCLVHLRSGQHCNQGFVFIGVLFHSTMHVRMDTMMSQSFW